MNSWPDMTSASLFASSTFLPARAAARVGARPAAPAPSPPVPGLCRVADAAGRLLGVGEHDGAAMKAVLDAVPADLRNSTWNYLLENADTSKIVLSEFFCGAAADPTMLTVNGDSVSVGDWESDALPAGPYTLTASVRAVAGCSSARVQEVTTLPDTGQIKVRLTPRKCGSISTWSSGSRLPQPP